MTAQIIGFSRRRAATHAQDDRVHPGSVLSAIRTGRSVNLARALADVEDRSAFFGAHYADIAAAICDRGDGDMLCTLLRLGFPMKSEFMEWVCRSGHLDLLKVTEAWMIISRPGRKPSKATTGHRHGHGLRIASE